MLDKNNLIALAKADAQCMLKPNSNFSFGDKTLSAEAIHSQYTKELNELAKTPEDFEENKLTIFRLINVGLQEVLPPRVIQNYGQFADIQRFAQGEKPVFTIRVSEASKKRAKSFVSKVGLAGRYETFKLDGYALEVPTSAFGGASRIEYEEVLDGRFAMSDYYNLVLEGLDEAIYLEIAKALTATVKNIPVINKYSSNVFDEKEFDRLLMIADTYGHATIYCTFEFAATMLPQNSWQYSNEMKNEVWNNGAFTVYKGHQVIILPQSFEDATNTTKMIDPSLCYIIPTGAEKPIKVAFEGTPQTKQFENRDWSTEIQTYQKVGVGVYLINPGICVYRNSALTKSAAGGSWTDPIITP